ncbi:MAG: sulfatase-like hydrolase/transferase, partial [bacterium]|nr:sulfatase-like hydrolase/transferase [bacterium]
MRFKKNIIILLALISCLLMSCTEKERSLPNIFLISLDTLRADYFTPRHMPLTYAWAKKNCRIFSNAHSNSTWTKPSHVTMFTGLRAKEHGVEYRDGEIPGNIVMIPRRLQQAGYRTCSFSSGGYVSKHYGFDRGFDYYWELKRVNPEIFDDHGQAFGKAREYLQKINNIPGKPV